MKFEDVKTVSETCMCTNVQRAARSLSRLYDEAFRPLGLTNWQFTLLVATYRPEPPTMNALAGALNADRTTITANLKPLETRGLVKVEPDKHDKRAPHQPDPSRRPAAARSLRNLPRQVGLEKELAFADLDGFRDNLRAVAAV